MVKVKIKCDIAEEENQTFRANFNYLPREGEFVFVDKVDKLLWVNEVRHFPGDERDFDVFVHLTNKYYNEN